MRLYHVTTTDRLDEIAAEGIVPGQRSTIGGPSYDAWKRGRAFVTSAKGVSFWLNRAELAVVDQHDDYDRKGVAPVVLEVTVDGSGLSPDDLGSADARAPAFFTTSPISPERIRVWTGREWDSIEHARVDLSDAFDEDGYLNSASKLRAPELDGPLPMEEATALRIAMPCPSHEQMEAPAQSVETPSP